MPADDDEYSISLMRSSDLEDLLILQHHAYRELAEKAEIMLEKFEAGRQLCFFARGKKQIPAAYLLAHPWHSSLLAPAWNIELPKLEETPDTVYLHDLAVAPAARGKDLGTHLAQKCLQTAKEQGLKFAKLIAVQNAQPFWQKLGFVAIDPTDEQKEILMSYGPDGVIMQKTL